MGEKCRHSDAESMRERQLTCDAKLAARVATQTADSLSAKLTDIKQSRDELNSNLEQTNQLLRERTQQLMLYFDQSTAVEVSIG